MKKIKTKLLVGASALMFIGAMFMLSGSALAKHGSDQALYENGAGKYCCAGSGGGCGAVACDPKEIE